MPDVTFIPISALLGVTWKLNPLEFDPPEHGRYRKILNPFFTPQAVAQFMPFVRECVDWFIDQKIESDPFDMIID